MARYERSDPIAEWLGEIQSFSDGLVIGANVLRVHTLEPSQQTAEDTEAARIALGLPEDATRTDDDFVLHDPWPLLHQILRWSEGRVAGRDGGPPMPDLSVLMPERNARIAPDWAVLTQNGEPQLLVMLRPELDPDGRGSDDEWEATPHQQLDRLVRETGVEIGLLVARNALRLVYAPKGETTGWMGWPLAPLGRNEGRVMLAGLKVALGRTRLFVGPSDQRLRPLLEESRRAQNEVSEKLSGQVLGALHELLRGLHAADPERIERLARVQPQHLYEGLLTCLMRLVFLLFAEDRDLLPTSREEDARQLWESGYSVRTLFARLEGDADLYFDVMRDRRGGWGQLLAVFRLVHGGYDNWIKGRGGKLFDPDVFPFLEGREVGEDPCVLPVSDACVYRILEGLMTLPAQTRGGARERLSYRSLDVEQIGSVYETVMGFTAERAAERMITVSDTKGLPTFVPIPALLAKKSGDRAKWLKENFAVELTGKRLSGMKTTADEATLLAALAEGQSRSPHRAGAIDLRGSPGQHPIPAGAPFLQPTDERRRSGSHYTPRELTHPIVAHALAPAFVRIGEGAAPEDVLNLKVCDPACGSGAFLVEACRQLGERLVAAWVRHPAERPTIPPDEDEQLHARRLVAQRCLYGVDKNPMAVDLARLSLWLATLAREHEFTFVDHALKEGDSLVGLTVEQLRVGNWDTQRKSQPIFTEFVDKALETARTGRQAIREAHDDTPRAVQERRHRRVEAALKDVRALGDAVVDAFFAAEGTSASRRRTSAEQRRQDVESWGSFHTPENWDRIEARANNQRARHGRPFHWPIEFPEVFDRVNPGFDAIIGNPPFAGKNTISAMGGSLYIPWLQSLHPGAHGNADLVAHFFRRAYRLLRDGGAFGLIASNTIAQGDTRASGLQPILADALPPLPPGAAKAERQAHARLAADRSRGGGAIMRATKRLPWPGEAAVVVSVVHVAKGPAPAPVLDGTEVERISAYLVPGDFDASPERLEANAGRAFQGSILLGMGFTFDDAAAAKGEAEPIARMHGLIEADPRNAERIKPYLGGEEVNTSPTHAHHRYAIDFEDFPLRRDPSLPSWFKNEGTEACEKRRRDWLRAGVVPGDYPDPVAADWPDLLEIVERRVKPDRDRQNRDALRKRWWQYAEKRPGLISFLDANEVVCGTLFTSQHNTFSRLPANVVFSNSVNITGSGRTLNLCVLQSRIHEVWTWYFSSTMEDRLRYSLTEAFETFPFPPGYEDDPVLEEIGRAYHDHRAALMVEAGEGMTRTYNRFHDPAERSSAIAELRALHDAMDHAVLRAYGWHDLAAPPGEGQGEDGSVVPVRAAPIHLAKTDEDGNIVKPGEPEAEHTYQGRLHWPQPTRDLILARLLALNATRAAGEPDPVYGGAEEFSQAAE